MQNFAVIDVETNYMDVVMSIGIVIADCQNMRPIDTKYYLIDPAYKMPAMYDRLFEDENVEHAVKEFLRTCKKVGLTFYYGGN